MTVRSFTTTSSSFAGVKTMRTTNTSSPGNCFSTVSGVVGCLMSCLWIRNQHINGKYIHHRLDTGNSLLSSITIMEIEINIGGVLLRAYFNI